MKELFEEKLGGLKDRMKKFNNELSHANPVVSDSRDFEELIMAEMKATGFEHIGMDKLGNITGELKGNNPGEDMAVLSHMDFSKEPGKSDSLDFVHEISEFKSGILTGIYACALLKNSLAPLRGNLVFCVVPRYNSGESCIEYFFNKTLIDKKLNIKNVLLCEPTGLALNLGHKGKMEYEIHVQGNFVEQTKGSRMELTFPLISELAKVSESLPADAKLGRSNLSVRDVNYMKYVPGEPKNGVLLTVDRVFIPEEDHNSILKRAKSIAEKVYSKNDNVSVSTEVATEKVKTHSGVELMLEKKCDPWIMEAYEPFVMKSLEALKESGLKPKTGYWKNTYTLGSFTNAKLKLPTIGFGAGTEKTSDTGEPFKISQDELEKAVNTTAWIIHRNIGIPTYGWTSDEI